MCGSQSYSTPRHRLNDPARRSTPLIFALLCASPSLAFSLEAPCSYISPSPATTYSYIPQPPDSAEINQLIREFLKVVGADLSQAEQYADQALTKSREINYTLGLIKSYRAKGDVFRIRGVFDESEKYIRNSISLSEKERDEIELAKGHLAMYRLLFAKGDYQGAAEFNKQPMEIGEKTSNTQILAEAFGNQGIIFGMKGEHITSVDLFLKSLEMYKALGDQLRIGITLMRIGHTFELAGSYDKALDYLLQALEINQQLDHDSNTGWTLLNIGVTYSRLEPDNFDKKLDYYNQALAMAEKSSDFRLILTCLDNIGGAYSMKGDFEKANRYLNRAYKLSHSAGHNSRTVFITGNLAENYLYMSKLDSALLFGKENLRIAIREQNAFEKRQAYSVLSDVYAARNEHTLAYEMLSRHLHISDSIFNAQKSQQIEDLREKYETQKKEQEIQSLTLEKSAAEFRRNTFALLALLFLTLGVLVFIVLRQRMKRNQLLLQKELELDRMKSRFFANISHEFRTPLTLILGPLDDMIGRDENSAHLKYLQPMRRNAARLLELVNQLLELSRIESGNMKLALSHTDVASLARGITMSFDSLAEMKNIRLEVTSSEDGITAWIDRDKLQKILTNLLSNAFKFTPKDRRIAVSISRSRSKPGLKAPECVEITVSDSGEGIAKADLDHIFDRFYQADNNQLRQQDGSGIGLALTKELVELHRGAIWAESQPGQGTIIHIQLPTNLDVALKHFIADADPHTLRSPQHEGLSEPEVNGEVESDSANQQALILIIEDQPDVRNYIRNSLEGFRVIEAVDGEEGIGRALNHIPDLILCDVMMPKKNGNEVCATLKRDERTSHIPLILLTAKADIESRIEGLETKADDYLTKPFVPKELLLRVRNLIESRQRLRDKYLQTMVLKPSDVAVTSVDEKFLLRIMDLLEIHFGDEKFGVEELGDEIGMSRSQLHRKLKALLGQGPNQFIRTFRLNRAHDLLKVNAATAAEVAYSVGFSSPSYFTKCFHEQFGYTPSEVSNHV